VFPGARSVSVEPASPGRLVVYQVRADGVLYYLRVAEEAGEDLTTDAQVLARLAGLGVRVPAVVHVEAEPDDLDRSFLDRRRPGRAEPGQRPDGGIREVRLSAAGLKVHGPGAAQSAEGLSDSPTATGASQRRQG
jgi:hypothetical protein